MGNEHATATDAYSAIRRLIRFIGDDPDREGLRETPSRVIRAFQELYSGYSQDPADLLKTFTDGVCDEMVIVKAIDFVSTCEHHMMQFIGVCHVAYLPDQRIIGLSKIPRLVDIFAKRLQVQERLTTQIAETLMSSLAPKGVGVVVEASHSCMSCRGIKKQRASMITSSLLGKFRQPEVRAEFLNLIR